MNLVTPIPTTFALPTVNLATEAARRDNLLKETIPQSADAEKGAGQQGLGAESDRARTPGQKPAPVTYEKPANAMSAQENTAGTSQNTPDNGADESAGRDDAQQRQQEQAQQREVAQLKQRDQEVRTHEQAHQAAGGQYASAPRYEYETGPDNKRYVTDGEVSIDVSDEGTPQKNLQKMEQVRSAALAPAEPSAQDMKVAAEASQKILEARQDIAAEVASRLSGVSEAGSSQRQATTSDNPEYNPAEYDRAQMSSRIGRIQYVYQGVGSPRSAGFSASA